MRSREPEHKVEQRERRTERYRRALMRSSRVLSVTTAGWGHFSELERELVRQALERCEGNQARAVSGRCSMLSTGVVCSDRDQLSACVGSPLARVDRVAGRTMLHEFLSSNHDAIVAAARRLIAARSAPRATESELEDGVPLFVDQLAEVLKNPATSLGDLTETAARRGIKMGRGGFTIAQVVHGYGEVCQALTSLAISRRAPITNDEFHLLNRCLDEAIARAVTAYFQEREDELRAAGNERLGILAHELRNLLTTSLLAFDVLKRGHVGIGGSTGAVLGRSLNALRELIDRSLSEVRLEAGVEQKNRIRVSDLLEEVQVAATIAANARGIDLTFDARLESVEVQGDRQLLASIISNLVQNAMKFTHPGGHVWLRARVIDDRVLIEVEDRCGGLPAGVAEDLFSAFTQRGSDRSGMGLGLTICRRGARTHGGDIHVRNLPGVGCVFTFEVPQAHP